MPKREYVLALICYLAIPAVVICGAGVFHLIDPEMARRHANYARDYRLLDLTSHGVLWASGTLALVLWTLCCYLVLKSRQRSVRWLYLAAAGPLGFSIIAALKDRSSAPGDLYQQVIRNLKVYWRAPLEIAVFVGVWFVAYQAVVLEREVMIRYESLATGTPVATIIAQQSASSGMWAAGEGMEQLYLVPLIYLLLPILFNLGGQLFKSSSGLFTQVEQGRVARRIEAQLGCAGADVELDVVRVDRVPAHVARRATAVIRVGHDRGGVRHDVAQNSTDALQVRHMNGLGITMAPGDEAAQPQRSRLGSQLGGLRADALVVTERGVAEVDERGVHSAVKRTPRRRLQRGVH